MSQPEPILPAETIAQILRALSATPFDQLRPLSLRGLATAADVGRASIYRARCGYMGPHVRRALSHALTMLQYRQVRAIVRSDPLEELQTLTGGRAHPGKYDALWGFRS